MKTLIVFAIGTLIFLEPAFAAAWADAERDRCARENGGWSIMHGRHWQTSNIAAFRDCINRKMLQMEGKTKRENALTCRRYCP
jgi:hypothetical protein